MPAASYVKAELVRKVALLPPRPGVYLWKDGQGTILYVGKAKNLHNRVRSYIQASNRSAKVKALILRAADVETIVTESEMEALILECNLIKQHTPKYNICLKDGKTYPFIRVTMGEEFPRVLIARRMVKDGSRYFGPFANAGAVHQTLKLLKRLFPFRTCRQLKGQRPCLQYHIHRCLAPCSGQVDATVYRSMMEDICLFLEGRSDHVAKDLRRRMQLAAAELEFELAARLRDQLAAVEAVQERQKMVTDGGDQDVLGLARSLAGTCVQVFFVRGGKMVGQDHFLLDHVEEETNGELLGAFIKQYYGQAAFVPKQLLLPEELPEELLLEQWLSRQKNSRVYLEQPQRGLRKELVDMATANAAHVLEQRAARMEEDRQRLDGALAELQRHLGLKHLPERMECFDISHIQGAETVASMVVFEGGQPKKEDYRRYKLKTVEGKPDDFKSMQEVVGRRYREPEQGAVPDLIIIDGGKGQLGVAAEIASARGLGDVPIVGLAKQFEYIFTPGSGEPIILPRQSQALFLMQRIRDEAHRFAITYHRKLRSRRNLVSVLDHIPGIGSKRRNALWQHFGSLGRIKEANEDELMAVPGMTRTAAQAVYRFFRRPPGE